MPVRWGARYGNAYDEDIGFVVREADEEKDVVINPHFKFVMRLFELKDQFRLTECEWATNIYNFVQDEVDDAEYSFDQEELFYMKNILCDLRDNEIGLKNYIEFFKLFGPKYFLNRFEKQLEHYYPEYAAENSVGWDRVWDSLNHAILHERTNKGQHFTPIPYDVSKSQLNEKFHEACVPPDMLHFAREAKVIAERCGDVSLAADVIKEANRFLTFQ